jgi:hypothetical protein
MRTAWVTLAASLWLCAPTLAQQQPAAQQQGTQQQQIAPQQQRARVIADRASVREQAKAGSAIVATVARDTELDVIATDGAWMRVRVRATGVEGFVPASFVQIATATDAPGASAAPDATSGASNGAAASTPATQPTQPTQPTPAPGLKPSGVVTSNRTFQARVFGGPWHTGATGFQVGVGVGITPFSNPAWEISADGSFYRIAQTNLFGGSVNGIFNIVLPSGAYTPFAGGGLAVVHERGYVIDLDPYGLYGDYGDYEYEIGGSTNVGFQLLGGVDFPFTDRRAFRGELRIQFLPTGTSVAVLAGLSF